MAETMHSTARNGKTPQQFSKGVSENIRSPDLMAHTADTNSSCSPTKTAIHDNSDSSDSNILLLQTILEGLPSHLQYKVVKSMPRAGIEGIAKSNRPIRRWLADDTDVCAFEMLNRRASTLVQGRPVSSEACIIQSENQYVRETDRHVTQQSGIPNGAIPAGCALFSEGGGEDVEQESSFELIEAEIADDGE